MHVSGNHLVDGSGRIITLHGANFSGTEFVCATSGSPGNVGWGIYGGPANQPATYQAMRAWHINAVRIPLNEDCWLALNGINPAYSGVNYRNAIVREVNTAEQAGLIIILDLHFSAYGSNLSNGQATMPDADHAPTFWAGVANTFKNNPGVIFDLYNEPHPHDGMALNPSDPWGWSCWLNGCAMATGPGWQSAGMQSLIHAVRGTGATNPVLVNGNGWANDDSGWLSHRPTDPANQMIAGVHTYPGQGCVFPSCWSNGPISLIAASFPVIVGETGDSAAGPVTYMNVELPFLDGVAVSYLAWTWNPWGDPDNVLIKDWSGTPTTGEGAYYRSHLLQRFP